MLKYYENDKVEVKVWLSEEATTHFHGRFIVENYKAE